jgi:hypothetical protein
MEQLSVCQKAKTLDDQLGREVAHKSANPG